MDPLTTFAVLAYVALVFVSISLLPNTPVGQAVGFLVTMLGVAFLMRRLDRTTKVWRLLAAACICALLMIPLTMWGKTWSPRTTEVSSFVFFGGAGIVALAVLLYHHFLRPRRA